MNRLWLLLLICIVLPAQAGDSLPSPLTLQQALKLADRQPAELLELLQQQASLKAQQHAAELGTAWRLALKAKAGRYQYAPSDHTFHRLVLQVDKTLWDGGEREALMQALNRQLAAVRSLENHARARYRLRIIRAFYNILLADLQYRALNEEMAVRYVTLDRARDRHELGTLSDVELARLEKDYQQLLLQRNLAELAQRQRRVELAILLNRPDAVIDEVVAPPLPRLPEKLPDPTEMMHAVMDHNPELNAVKKQLVALADKRNWARAARRPRISMQAYGGMRHIENEVDKDHWRVQLALDWPLLDGGMAEQRLARVSAEQLALKTRLKQLRQRLEQRVVQLWQTLAATRTRKAWLHAYEDFVDLNMEYRRGLYENEERTDIGDAMIEQSRYDLESLKAAMETALSWYEFKVLQGEQIP